MATAAAKKQIVRGGWARESADMRGTSTSVIDSKEIRAEEEKTDWESEVPNEETLRAMEDVRCAIANGGKGRKDIAEFFSVEELMADLNADD